MPDALVRLYLDGKHNELAQGLLALTKVDKTDCLGRHCVNVLLDCQNSFHSQTHLADLLELCMNVESHTSGKKAKPYRELSEMIEKRKQIEEQHIRNLKEKGLYRIVKEG